MHEKYSAMVDSIVTIPYVLLRQTGVSRIFADYGPEKIMKQVGLAYSISYCICNKYFTQQFCDHSLNNPFHEYCIGSLSQTNYAEKFLSTLNVDPAQNGVRSSS